MAQSAFPCVSSLTTAVRSALLPLTALCAVPALAETPQAGETPIERMVVTASALKASVPMADAPQSVSLVSGEALAFRQVQKLDEALRFNAGVLSAPYGADNDADWIKVRGFDAATYLDGSRLFKDGYYGWMLEPYGLDRVELLKGPASILYGEAPPGGVVNAVLKKPTETAFGELSLQLGSRNHHQIGLDLGGPTGDSGDRRYRVVGLFKEGDGELDHTDNSRYYLAPSVAWDLSERTTFTLLTSVMQDDGTPTNGFFPAYGTLITGPEGTIDRRTNLGEPEYDTYQRTQAALGYQLDHQIGEHWDFHQNFQYGYNDLLLRSVYAFPSAEAGPLTQGLVYREGDIHSLTLDSRAIGQWYGDKADHTLLLGLDLQSHRNRGQELDDYAFGTIDPFNPVYGDYTPLDPDSVTARTIDKRQSGLYGQYQFKWDQRWIGIIGGRYDYVDTRNHNRTAGVVDRGSEDQLSLNAGLMYQSDLGLSPYISYAESFEVIGTVDPATGELYKPLEGQQTEVGIKYQPYGFDGYLNLAWFDLVQTHALVTNPDTWVQTQTGEVSSRGVELEGAGYLTEALMLTASYTYTDARTDETYGQGTRRAGMIPRHQANLWLDYDLASVPGLKLGTGVRYVGSSVDNPASSDRKIPAYTLWDLALKYELNPRWQLQLNANNLLDEAYVSACDYYCYYGESRRLLATLNYRW